MKLISKLIPALKIKLVIPILSLIVVAVFASIVTYQVTKKDVTVNQDGEVTTVSTHAETVEEVLHELEIEFDKHDDISYALDHEVINGMEIDFKEANQITLTIDGNEETYHTTKDTVKEFLEEQKINVKKHDFISMDMDKEIESGLKIKIDKAFQVTINDGGEEQSVWTTGGTVEDILESEEISLGELDRLEPEVTTPLQANDAIEITRVEKVTDIIKETKDYAVVKRKDDSLEKGKEKVVAAGEEGIIAKHYEVVLENGEEVSRELVKEVVEKESEQRVVAVGTKENVETLSVSRGDNGEEVKEYLMTATVYTEKCNGCRGITYTGIDLRNNPDAKVVAVDPNVIPLGSKVWVEGYGNAIAADIGGAIKGNRIDLFKHSSVYNGGYGHKQVRVKVYE